MLTSMIWAECSTMGIVAVGFVALARDADVAPSYAARKVSRAIDDTAPQLLW